MFLLLLLLLLCSLSLCINILLYLYSIDSYILRSNNVSFDSQRVEK